MVFYLASGPLACLTSGVLLVAATTSEPAWHRRARARRADARTLLRVASAQRLLAEHHSAQRGPGTRRSPLSHAVTSMGSDEEKTAWLCKSCKGPDGKPFQNRGTRKECFKCKVGKGACFAGAVGDGTSKRTSNHTRGTRQANSRPSAADIVAKQALQQKREMEQQLQQLRSELAEVKKGNLAPPACEMEADSHDDEKEAKAELATLRADLKQLQSLSADLQARHGIAEQISSLKSKIEGASAKMRGNRPLDVRLASQSAHTDRMEALEAAAANRLAELQEKQSMLAKQIEEQQATQAAAASKAKEARDELASLKSQKAAALAAEVGPSMAPTQGAAQEPPPGCVSIAFAEAKWAEREAAFAQQVAQLQALVSCQSASTSEGSAGSEASPSVSGDLASVDDLEDDDTWSKVVPGKRKALLCRERDALATKMRSTLGKVSAVSSPFKKPGPGN